MKIRYDRLITVGVIVSIIIGLFIYLMSHKVHDEEYNGKIETYVASYRQNDKIYTFDLKAFQKDDIWYASLNDMYNMVVIMDKNARVYIDQNKHTLTYQLSDSDYHFDYGRGRIVYNNDSIDLRKNSHDIYISHKNVYVSVYFIEKIVLKNEKKINLKNKNAIIE